MYPAVLLCQGIYARILIFCVGSTWGEALMIELTKCGVGRQEAHEIVRSIAILAHKGGQHIKDVLLANKEVAEYLSEDDIVNLVNLVNPDRYIGTAVEQVEVVVAKLQKKSEVLIKSYKTRYSDMDSRY